VAGGARRPASPEVAACAVAASGKGFLVLFFKKNCFLADLSSIRRRVNAFEATIAFDDGSLIRRLIQRTPKTARILHRMAAVFSNFLY
jgi:uncharacterized membrane protein YvbJ